MTNLFVYWLSGFNWIDKRSNNDLLLTFGFKEHPLAVCIRSEWRRKNDIMSNMTTPGGFVGPTTIAINKKTGSKKSFFLLGQPDGFPLQDNVLLISAEQNSLPEGANNPSMVFLGGFDEHEITAIRPNPKIKGALAFLYPLR